LLKGNTEIGELKNDHDRENVLDDGTLAQLVADRLDLPISQNLLQEKKIPRSIIERCWMDQLRFKRNNTEIFFFSYTYFYLFR